MVVGRVGFEGLSIRCIIGDRAHERKQEQEIVVDIYVDTDFSAAGQSDKLQDTVDYSHLSSICEETAKKGRYRLLEAYAMAATTAILKVKGVSSVWMRVRKPGVHRPYCPVVELKRELP